MVHNSRARVKHVPGCTIFLDIPIHNILLELRTKQREQEEIIIM